MLATVPTAVLELFPRVHAMVKARGSELADSVMEIPLANYRDPSVLQDEMEHVFGRSPIAILPGAMIPDGGDYVTRQLPDGRSVVVIRGDDGATRVLLNVCRHRGARVAGGAGCSRRLTCGYHGWSYDKTGALVGQPGRAGFDDIELSALGLVELPSEESFGFVWFTPEAAQPVAAHLGEFAEHFAAFDYASYEANPAMEVEVSANWKSVIEAFYETCHFPYVHKDSLVGQATISNTVTFDAYGRHARIAVPGKGMLDLTDDAEANERHFSVIYFIYPNLVISNTLLGCEIIEARPAGSPGRAVLRHTLLSKVDVGSLGGGTNDDYLEAIRDIVLNEDGTIITSSGLGIADAGHEFVVFGRNEIGCQHIHRQIADGIEQGKRRLDSLSEMGAS